MQILAPRDYHKLPRSLELHTYNHIYPESIYRGYQSGEILVDDLEQIQCALFWHKCGFGYLAGNPSYEVLNEIATLIREQGEGQTRRCSLQLDSGELEPFFLKQEGITRSGQYGFGFCREKWNPKNVQLQEGFKIKEMDHEILSRLQGRIIPSFSWDNEAEFLKKGKGFCILHGDEIAASSFTAAISDDQIDIGIETNPDYRNRGFASILANCMVEYVLSIGKTPRWQCHESNLGSKAVAESAGFVAGEKHSIFMKQ